MRNYNGQRDIPTDKDASGLVNAPTTFQRMMDNTFSDLKLSYILIYLDDVNVFFENIL